jgi:rubredoxin
MNESKIKQALSYSLGSDLHEAWRAPRKLSDGTYEPRIKKSKDEEWTMEHGTDEVDIANCTFSELPSNWQYENLEAASVAINLVYDKIINGEQITSEERLKIASSIHDEWLKRNSWVFDPNNGDPKLAVPFDQLSKEEQDKDLAQIEPAINKIKSYINEEININDICKQFNIQSSSKQL